MCLSCPTQDAAAEPRPAQWGGGGAAPLHGRRVTEGAMGCRFSPARPHPTPLSPRSSALPFLWLLTLPTPPVSSRASSPAASLRDSEMLFRGVGQLAWPQKPPHRNWTCWIPIPPGRSCPALRIQLHTREGQFGQIPAIHILPETWPQSCQTS